MPIPLDKFEECTCGICTSQDISDNFGFIGKKYFTNLALAALVVSKNDSEKSKK